MRRADVLSNSFKFKRNERSNADSETPKNALSTQRNRNEGLKYLRKLTGSRLSVTKEEASKCIRNGADKLSKTLNSVQTTIGVLSQKFRRSTRRRHRLKSESPHSPLSPLAQSRRILGRTPTKLYSPFDIDVETPCRPNKENLFITPSKPIRKSLCGKRITPEDKSRMGKTKSYPGNPGIVVWEYEEECCTVIRRRLRH